MLLPCFDYIPTFLAFHTVIAVHITGSLVTEASDYTYVFVRLLFSFQHLFFPPSGMEFTAFLERFKNLPQNIKQRFPVWQGSQSPSSSRFSVVPFTLSATVGFNQPPKLLYVTICLNRLKHFKVQRNKIYF